MSTSKAFKMWWTDHKSQSERKDFMCIARGCDGCLICNKKVAYKIFMQDVTKWRIKYCGGGNGQ